MGVMLKLYTVLQSVNWSATQVSHRIVVIKDCFAENDPPVISVVLLLMLDE